MHLDVPPCRDHRRRPPVHPFESLVSAGQWLRFLDGSIQRDAIKVDDRSVQQAPESTSNHNGEDQQCEAE